MHAAWHNLKADTKDTRLRKAVCRACKKVKRTRNAGITRFFGPHVQEMEEQLCRRDQRRFFQHLKSMGVGNTRKVDIQCIHGEDGSLLRDKDIITQRCVRLLPSLPNAKLDPGIISKLPQQTNEVNLGGETNGGRGSKSAPREGELESSGNEQVSRGGAGTRTELLHCLIATICSKGKFRSAEKGRPLSRQCTRGKTR